MSKKQIHNKSQKYYLWAALAFGVLLIAIFGLQMLQQQTEIHSDHEPENPDVLLSIEGLQNKVQLSDGTTKYTFDSPNPSRPNMYIAREESDTILFERSVISQEGKAITLTDYLAAFGEPEQIVNGTQFYGSGTDLYIYADRGLAFIANPQLDRILELHTFPIMSADEYLQNYEDEN